jgi:large subunit ribosomal protein L15
MQTHSLQLKNKRKHRKIIGRGGKKGTYSGKGNKGQKARSGAHVDPLFEGGRSTLIDHMKKKRGFKSSASKKIIVKMADLEKKFKSGNEISLDSLKKAGLVGKKCAAGIKILGSGGKEFTIGKGISFSSSAKKNFKKTETKKVSSENKSKKV